MQRRPGQSIPILFERPTHEWVARVNQKHKQLDELQLSTEQRQTLDRWIEIEFIYSTLTLEGADIKRDLVARMTSSGAGSGDSEKDASARALFESLRIVTSIAREKGKDSLLSVDLLLKLNSPPSAPGLRCDDSASELMRENIPVVLDSACQWFEADSFRELHPVEQASIVFLRLLELHPFVQRNERTALLAASLFTLRSKLPPIILRPEARRAYRAALDEGLRMNTKPMVEFLAESVERTLDSNLAASK